MDISKAKDILDYWFSNDPYTPNYDKWFLKSQDYDNEIKLKFGNLLKQAEQGKGFAWLNTKDSYIAYIILLDQFSRHIYRGTGESFKNDNAAIIFLEMGWNLYENQLQGYEIMFSFMPYMHSENIKMQYSGKSCFDRWKKYDIDEKEIKIKKNLIENNNLELNKIKSEIKMCYSMLPHIEGHLKTIQKFGRFPKRNLLLYRESTPDEIKYMEQPEVKRRPY